ncbi:MAG: WD40 repeat domain-containing protein [Halobacteriovoraceae bacterium]|nr:WD40 repeat domain-containing protein [Halobacteriovoraceae bacterium]
MVCNASDPIRCKETGYSNAECFQIWDVQEGSLVQSFDFQGWDLEECINDKDVFIGIATCGIGGEARIWSKTSGELIWKVDCFPRLMLDNHILIGVKYDPMNFRNATIQLWRKFDGTSLLSINAPNLNHWSLFFDANHLFGLTNDGIINIWDKNSGELVNQYMFSNKICLICPLEDQSEFLCVDEDVNAFVLDNKKSQPKAIFSAVEQKIPKTKTVHKPFFDQEVLVISTEDQITCWNRSNQEVLFHFNVRVAQLLGMYADHIIFWNHHGPIQIIDKHTGKTLSILEIQHTVPTHRKLKLNDHYLFVLHTETNTLEIWNKYKSFTVSKIDNVLDFEVKDDIVLLVFVNGKVQNCDFSFKSKLPIKSSFSFC